MAEYITVRKTIATMKCSKNKMSTHVYSSVAREKGGLSIN